MQSALGQPDAGGDGRIAQLPIDRGQRQCFARRQFQVLSIIRRQAISTRGLKNRAKHALRGKRVNANGKLA